MLETWPLLVVEVIHLRKALGISQSEGLPIGQAKLVAIRDAVRGLVSGFLPPPPARQGHIRTCCTEHSQADALAELDRLRSTPPPDAAPKENL